MTDLPAPGAFEWTNEPWGRALRCSPLARVAPHVFTSRDAALESIDEPLGAGWAAAAGSVGAGPGDVVRLRQVHGTVVVVVREGDWPARWSGALPEADALVTDRPGVALAVRVADCNPILIADARHPAVAAIHAGWRGTCAGIVAATVRTLAGVFGSVPGDLVAAVGPSIGPCCYRVGTEVRDAFAGGGASQDALTRWFLATPAPFAGEPDDRGRSGDSPGWELGASDFRLPRAEQLSGFGGAHADHSSHLWADLWTAAADQLAAAGLAPEHVHVARVCTSCRKDLFYSYRADGAAGRTAGLIRVAGRH